VRHHCRRDSGQGPYFAGETTLAEYIDLAAACRVYLTNDSGGMHVASATGSLPQLRFSAPRTTWRTGPTGPSRASSAKRWSAAPVSRECPHRPSLHDPFPAAG